MGFLPKHYASEIDFERQLGKFKAETEPKLVYKDKEFVFRKSFEEMLADFRLHQPQMLVNEKGESKLIPYDWTIYYLRKKALSQRIEKEELAWILLNFNQKRGYYQLREEDEEATDKKEYVLSLRVIQIDEGENDKKNDKKKMVRHNFREWVGVLCYIFFGTSMAKYGKGIFSN
jgi:CRISPR-associated endonuclease Csn1